MSVALLLSLSLSAASLPPAPPPPDTLRLEVGSLEVDGRIFPPHRARNRVYIGDAEEPVVTWTNELMFGDSAGIHVMRWITRGEPGPASTGGQRWELLQTYDARTLAPIAYSRTSTSGAETHLRFDGTRVHGVTRGPGAGAVEESVDLTLARRGYIAGASDLVPMAVRLREGLVVSAPFWSPGMTASEERVFTVVARERVTVEGEAVEAWRVDEHLAANGRLIATWWLTDESPYMVLGEIPLPDGGVQRITGVALD